MIQLNYFITAKFNLNNSESLLLDHWLKRKLSLPDCLVWKKGRFKYLGDEMNIQKNWEGVTDKVKGMLKKM